MAALKLGYVNPAVVKMPSSFHASGSRLIKPPHNVFMMPSTTIQFPSVVLLNRRQPIVMKCCFTNNNNTLFSEKKTNLAAAFGGSSFSSRSISLFYSAPSRSVRVYVSLDMFWLSFFLVLLADLVFSFLDMLYEMVFEAPTSVIKLQVGLLDSGKSLEKDLNSVFEKSTSNDDLLTETILVLLRHPYSFISAYSSVNISMDGGEKRFKQLYIEEQAKLNVKTLVNVNNIKKQSSTTMKGVGNSSEFIVLTILVTARGRHSLPSINNIKDLKDAMQKLATIESYRTRSVRVFTRTFQHDDDTLSPRELLEDYPLLRPL